MRSSHRIGLALMIAVLLGLLVEMAPDYMTTFTYVVFFIGEFLLVWGKDKE